MKVEEIAELVGGKLNGSGAVEILRVASFENSSENEISFVEKIENAEAAKNSKAACLFIPENFPSEIPCAIVVKNPKLAFAKTAEILHRTELKPAWDDSVIIPDSSHVRASIIGSYVTIGENSYIGEYSQIHHGVKIGNNVTIRKGTVIYPNCVIYDNVEIGYDCIIHAGTIIGADGFGFVRDGANGYVKFPQIGTVEIGDNVEIGANSCVDRGALGATKIGSGTKIDNLVQIAHNVEIGERVVIAAQTGISGSTVIESDAVIGGQVGMGDHARILSGAIIGSQAGVLPGKIVRAGVWWGTPVQPLDEYKRQNAMVKGLARLKDEVKQLRKKLDESNE